jgi:hypothetical protein
MRDEKMGTPRGRRLVGRVVSLLGATGVGAGLVAAASLAAGSAPVNSAPPTISGTFRVGESVKSTTGSWSNNPTSFSYEWRRCNDSGSGCTDIASATTKSYTLVSADAGRTVVVAVTAANSDGKASASSQPSPVVSDGSAPRNTGRPQISGTAQVGQVLQVSKGSWAGGVRSFDYQWQRCDKQGNNCKPEDGATAPTYGVRSADVGLAIRAEVTASNGAGKTTVDTDRSDSIQPAAGTVFSCPSGTTVQASQLQPPIRLQIDRFQFSPSVVTRSTPSITARYHISDTCGRSVVGAQLWSTAIPYNQVTTQRGTTAGDGWGTLTFAVSRGGFPAAPGRQ